MKLKIDQFYEDKHLGRLKYKGLLEGNLIFDNYTKAFGTMGVERVTLQPRINRKRIANLRPSFPPE